MGLLRERGVICIARGAICIARRDWLASLRVHAGGHVPARGRALGCWPHVPCCLQVAAARLPWERELYNAVGKQIVFLIFFHPAVQLVNASFEQTHA